MSRLERSKWIHDNHIVSKARLCRKMALVSDITEESAASYIDSLLRAYGNDCSYQPETYIDIDGNEVIFDPESYYEFDPAGLQNYEEPDQHPRTLINQAVNSTEKPIRYCISFVVEESDPLFDEPLLHESSRDLEPQEWQPIDIPTDPTAQILEHISGTSYSIKCYQPKSCCYISLKDLLGADSLINDILRGNQGIDLISDDAGQASNAAQETVEPEATEISKLQIRLKKARHKDDFRLVSQLPDVFDELLEADLNSTEDRKVCDSDFNLQKGDYRLMLPLVKYAKKHRLSADGLIETLIKDAFVEYWSNESCFEMYLKREGAFLGLAKLLREKYPKLYQLSGTAEALLRAVSSDRFYYGKEISVTGNSPSTIAKHEAKFLVRFKQARQFVSDVYGIKLKLGHKIIHAK